MLPLLRRAGGRHRTLCRGGCGGRAAQSASL